LQRLQAPVPERDVEDAIGRRAEEGLRYRIQSRGIILESCLFNRGELGWAGVHG
jgi:hypothetical protein